MKNLILKPKHGELDGIVQVFFWKLAGLTVCAEDERVVHGLGGWRLVT